MHRTRSFFIALLAGTAALLAPASLALAQTPAAPDAVSSFFHWRFPFGSAIFGFFERGIDSRTDAMKENLENNQDLRISMLNARRSGATSTFDGMPQSIVLDQFPARQAMIADQLSLQLGYLEQAAEELSGLAASSTADGKDMGTTTSLISQAMADDQAARSAIQAFGDYEPSVADIVTGSVDQAEIQPLIQNAVSALATVRTDLESAVSAAKTALETK